MMTISGVHTSKYDNTTFMYSSVDTHMVHCSINIYVIDIVVVIYNLVCAKTAAIQQKAWQSIVSISLSEI